MADAGVKVEADIHKVRTNCEEDAPDEDSTGRKDVAPKRIRKMTAAGLEYVLDRKRKRLDQLSRFLTKISDELIEMIDMDKDESQEQIKKGYRKWISLYDELLLVDSEYREVMSSVDAEQYNTNWFAPRNADFQEFKAVAEKWFCENSSTISEASTKDDKSVSSSSHSSRCSSQSRQSIMSAKLIQEQERAMLAVKLKQRDKKKALEHEKLRLKQQEEDIELEEALEINNAKCEVLDKFEIESVRSCCLSEDKKSTAHSHISDAIITSPEAKEIYNPSSISPGSIKYADVTPSAHISEEDNNLSSVVHHMQKPASFLEKFSGDPLQYQRFMRQFRTKVVAHCQDPDERMNFLDQYTTGDAKKIVVGYSYMDASKGYDLAMKELKRRYGDPEIMVNAFIEKAISWPTLKSDNPKDLDYFALFLSECEHAVESLNAMKILEYAENFKRIVGKLPFVLQDRWRQKVFQLKDKQKRITFHDLVDFKQMESRKANDPMLGREALGQLKKSSEPLTGKQNTAIKSTAHSHAGATETISQSNTSAKQSDTKQPTDKKICIHCNAEHLIETCTSLAALPFQARLDILRSHGLCFGCLRAGHMRNLCRNRATCTTCNRRHPTVLHIIGSDNGETNSQNSSDVQSGNDATHTQLVSSVECHTGAADVDCTMAVIPVTIRAKNGIKQINTYAFLDPGSNVSFCSENIAHELYGSLGKKMTVKLNTMGAQLSITTHRITGLEISSLDGGETIELPAMYTKDRMPVTKQHIPTDQDISHWPHLQDLTLPQIDGNIDLLIGNNIPDVYTPLDLKTGPRGSPHAALTMLGWVVWNVVREHQPQRLCVNHAGVQAVLENEELRQLDHMYRESIKIDFPERIIDDVHEPSIEDNKFIKKINMTQMDDGHFQLNLPFCKDEVKLPNNSEQIFKRLMNLEKKLKKNDQFRSHYVEFMESIINNGYAIKVPEAELLREDGRVWYLPHHGVYHKKKQDKIRVVFDCAATYRGISLNSVLLQGPDLGNSLLGVLLRFRENSVALMADIQAMFHQVRVPMYDQDCLRFFWWPNGDLDRTPEIFRMTVHLFGAVSSPTCCNLALRKVAEDQQDTFPEASRPVLHDFYVDDFLKSVESTDEALSLVEEVTTLCQRGGFRLTKWVSNSIDIPQSIPQDDRAKELKDLSLDATPVERALGVFWNIKSDQFGFRIMTKDLPATRRNILSYVCSVYDPLGFASPCVLIAKSLLQELCRLQFDWDAILSGKHLVQWKRWLADLPKLEHLSVPRCLKPSGMHDISCTQFHYFTDASEMGYGVVVYVRFTDNRGNVHCHFLLSRARVAPIKSTTIPRLELTAAVIAVKMHRKLQDELDLHPDLVFFWTDSMSVIRYIANEKTRFQTFVTDRIAIIREGSSVEQWRHIDSNCNPADCVSRGLTADALLQAEWWLKAPNFLWEPYTSWMLHEEACLQIPVDDPEVKKEVCAVQITPIEKLPLCNLLERCSSWMKIRRVVAWIERYLAKLRCHVEMRRISEIRSPTLRTNNLCLEEEFLTQAENTLCRNVQKKYFHDEIEDLEKGKTIKAHSPLSKLDPFIADGILRVGGRLRYADLTVDAKYPVILPKDATLSRLILEYIHVTTGHLGQNMMLSRLRQRFWIVGATSAIRRLMSRCVVCKKYASRTLEQKMSDIPKDRVTPEEPPFTRVGTDYFGPFEIKRGRSLVKRYGIIFTCLATRAVHLEIAHSLDTASCINAIRRFTARRGAVKIIRSDNGTNLVGAEKELREALVSWNNSAIQDAASLKGIQWTFNPPSGSHFGGIWERLIRQIRKILYSLMREQTYHLDDEGLLTLFCEVENIMNSRPLTCVSNDPNDLEVLTPNHLLLLHPGETLPCGVFDESDNYPRRRWRQIQYLANTFWTRWIKEYLPLLQSRQKWLQPKRNVSVGDIVMIADNSPRNSWTLGRVTEVMMDSKGIVRIAKVKTPTNVLQRPIHKLCMILESDMNPEENR